MKVVFLKDVAGAGRAGEVKEVSDGYAVNFLIPRRLAEAGTAAALARIAKRASAALGEARVQGHLLAQNLAALTGLCLEIKGKANEKGHLFASIHADAIVSELKKQKGIDILPEFLILQKPLKEVGEHEIPVRAGEKHIVFTLLISPLPPSA